MRSGCRWINTTPILDWGRANFDVRHRAFIGGNVGLPFRMTAAPFITMQSGTPFNITTGDYFQRRRNRECAALVFHRSLRHYGECTPYGTFNLAPAAGDARIPHNYAQGPPGLVPAIRPDVGVG